MNAPILRRLITSKKWWLFGWSLGIVSLITLTLGFYPSFRDQADEFNEMVEKMPQGIKSLIGMGGWCRTAVTDRLPLARDLCLRPPLDSHDRVDRAGLGNRG